MDNNAKKALKTIKMEIAAEHEMHPENIFDLIEKAIMEEFQKLN